MPDLDSVHDAVERLEWADSKQEETSESRRWALTRRTALTGGAAGIAAFMIEACGGGSSSSSAASTDVFGSHPSYKFTFVNHVTTNPFFVPTQYGAEDACKLLGCSYQWTGSATSNVSEMVNADQQRDHRQGRRDRVVADRPDRVQRAGPEARCSQGSRSSPTTPTQPATTRLAYIGQDLFVSGQQMGQHIVELRAVRRRHRAVHRDAGLAQHPAADRRRQGHARRATRTSRRRGRHRRRRPARADGDQRPAARATRTPRACSRSTPAAPRASPRRSRSRASRARASGGGYDLTPITEQLLAAGYIEFTIDQQPYLQGFLPILRAVHVQGVAGR